MPSLQSAKSSNLNTNNLSGDPRLRVGALGLSMTDSIERTLGRIEEKIDNLVLSTQPRLNNHSDRIGKLERWQSRVLGGAAVAGFLLGVAITLWK
jgi:hypothetical protein